MLNFVLDICYIFSVCLDGSDTTSHTNTIELYGPSKETALYPMASSDGDRSYGTYDKNDDDFSDDYKSYEVSIYPCFVPRNILVKCHFIVLDKAYF